MSNAETNMKISHMNNLRIFLWLAWYLPFLIFFSTVFFIYKEILNLPLVGLVQNIIVPYDYYLVAETIIIFIYNDVALRPLFLRCRGEIHDYRLKVEAIDLAGRWTCYLLVIHSLFFGGLFLTYFWGASRPGWAIVSELKPALNMFPIISIIALSIWTLFVYLWARRAAHSEKESYEHWLETELLSFPLKSGIILFVLTLIGQAYSSLFYNFLFEGQMSIILISALSVYLILSLLYYYLIKWIIGGFLEKHDTLLL